ncbi:aldehyde dehydrogenase [Alicyclobacillus curvatus]|jgi:phenylacetaldehyde dehydrogenase|nr:aldehyde dehydrogenase [Alicyclobacillus curvatus]
MELGARLLHAQLYIDDSWTSARDGKTMEVFNPANGRVIGVLDAARANDVDIAVMAAHRAFLHGEWSRASIQHRSKVLNKFADLFEAHLEEFYELETLNNGRPIQETRAQISRLPQFYRYFAALNLTLRSDVIPIEGDYLNYTQRVPLGVCALLTSFNHPLMILSKSLAPALAAGNSVVIKPSEQTPFTTVKLVELLTQSGIPKGIVNLIHGSGLEAGAPLTEHPLVRKVVFTGGTEVGRSIAQAAARHFASTTLELGGKGAVLVFDDMDRDRAINGAAFAAFIASGQTCVCGSRILVQKTMYREFLERFEAKVRAIQYGDPFSPDTQLGPVISERSRQRILGMLQTACNQGARLLTGGSCPTDTSGFYIHPTVLVDVHPNMQIMQDEVFGPVTAVMPFDNEEDALRIANETRFGLAASVWTKDVERAHRVANNLRFGMVWINDHHRLDPASPWGGFKDSGIGRETGLESYLNFTEVRSVTVNTTGKTVDWYDHSTVQRRLN